MLKATQLFVKSQARIVGTTTSVYSPKKSRRADVDVMPGQGSARRANFSSVPERRG